MANDYSSLGFSMNSKDDVLQFTNEYADEVMFYETSRGGYGVLELGSRIELWYYGNENGVSPLSMELCHKSGRIMKLTDCEWLSFAEDSTDSALLSGFLDEGDTGFPLNIDVVNACEFIGSDAEDLNGETCGIDFTLFARQVSVFDNVNSFNEIHSEGMAAESCIPCGTFPLDGDPDFEPSATALLNGIVYSAEHMTNPATGLTYWRVTLNCLGMQFDAVIADELVPDEILPGNVIKGYYWLPGKLKQIDRS